MIPTRTLLIYPSWSCAHWHNDRHEDVRRRILSRPATRGSPLLRNGAGILRRAEATPGFASGNLYIECSGEPIPGAGLMALNRSQPSPLFDTRVLFPTLGSEAP